MQWCVQGVLVTTNSFNEAWRSRASAETIHILSSAAHELLALHHANSPNTTRSPAAEVTGRLTSNTGRTLTSSSLAGVVGEGDGLGDQWLGEEGEISKRRRRTPSKWRRVAEQAAMEFEYLDAGAAVVDACGHASTGALPPALHSRPV